MFFDAFSDLPQFQDETNSKKFQEILKHKKSFAEAKREACAQIIKKPIKKEGETIETEGSNVEAIKESNKIIDDNGPSPCAYKNNPYDLPESKRQLNKIFQKKLRYNSHIFVNKNGPLFPQIMLDKHGGGARFLKDLESMLTPEDRKLLEDLGEVGLSKPEGEGKDGKNIKSRNKSQQQKKPKTLTEHMSYEAEEKNKINLFLREAEKRKLANDKIKLQCNIPGKSIGMVTNRPYGFYKMRREEKSARNLPVEDAFLDDGSKYLSTRSPPKNIEASLSQEKYALKRDKKIQKKLLAMRENQEKLKERHQRMNTLNEEQIKEKIKIILEREEKYDKKREQYEKEKEKIRQQKQNLMVEVGKTLPGAKTRAALLEPKGKFYDIKSFIQPDKGFSFGMKLPFKTRIPFDSPDYVYLKDDFEKLIDKNSLRPNIKFKGERFPKVVVTEAGDPQPILDKQKAFEERRNIMQKNRTCDFFNDRNKMQKLVNENKKSMAEIEQEEKNNIIEKQYPDYYYTDINYSQVETASPKFTLKGRYDTGMVGHNTFKRTMRPEEEFMNKLKGEYNLTDMEGKMKGIFENETIKVDFIKPKWPKYSFGKADRGIGVKKQNKSFSQKDLSRDYGKINNKTISDYYLFSNGIYGYNDTQSFLKTQTTMGTSEKLDTYKFNGVPGPGMYPFKTFADLIVQKNLREERLRNRTATDLFANTNNISSINGNISKSRNNNLVEGGDLENKKFAQTMQADTNNEGGVNELKLESFGME